MYSVPDRTTPRRGVGIPAPSTSRVPDTWIPAAHRATRRSRTLACPAAPPRSPSRLPKVPARGQPVMADTCCPHPRARRVISWSGLGESPCKIGGAASVGGGMEDPSNGGSMKDLRSEVRDVLRDHARLPEGIDGLADDADLFQAGMSSHASVNLMLALEDAFDVEFPDSMLKRSVFESVTRIALAVGELQEQAA